QCADKAGQPASAYDECTKCAQSAAKTQLLSPLFVLVLVTGESQGLPDLIISEQGSITIPVWQAHVAMDVNQIHITWENIYAFVQMEKNHMETVELATTPGVCTSKAHEILHKHLVVSDLLLDWVSGNWYFVTSQSLHRTVGTVVTLCNHDLKHCTVLDTYFFPPGKLIGVNPLSGNLYLKDKYGEPDQCNLLERNIDGKTTSMNMCSSGQRMLGSGIGLHGNVTIKYALVSSESPNSNVTYLKIFTPNFNETILLLPDEPKPRIDSPLHEWNGKLYGIAENGYLWSRDFKSGNITRNAAFSDLGTSYIFVYHPRRLKDHPCQVQNGGCDHLCIPLWSNEQPSRKCTCSAGYVLQHGSQCKKIMTQIALLVSDVVASTRVIGNLPPGLLQIMTQIALLVSDVVASTRVIPLDGGPEDAFSLPYTMLSAAYDWMTSYIHYVDRYSWDKYHQDLTIEQPKVSRLLYHSSYAIAIDWQRRNLYWSSSYGSSDRISVISLDDSRNNKTLLTASSKGCYELVLDHLHGYMYFIDVTNNTLYEAWMDGSHKTQLTYVDTYVGTASLELQSFHQLAIDAERRHLYYTRTLNSSFTIERMDLANASVKEELHRLEKGSYVLDLIWLRDRLYFLTSNISDHADSTVKVQILHENGSIKSVFESEWHLASIYQFLDLSSKNGTASPAISCDASCKHLCLPTPEGPKCHCNDGYLLGSDEPLCVVDDSYTKENPCEGKFSCRSVARCIPMSYVCDGDIDCLDGSDEDPTPCAPLPKLCDARLEVDHSIFSAVFFQVCRIAEVSFNARITFSYLHNGSVMESQIVLIKVMKVLKIANAEKDIFSATLPTHAFYSPGSVMVLTIVVLEMILMREAAVRVSCFYQHQYSKRIFLSLDATSCGNEEFRCQNGRCISLQLYCNSVDDCGDGSDESLCETYVCPDGSVFCTSDKKCIPSSRVCDGFKDCIDGTDETLYEHLMDSALANVEPLSQLSSSHLAVLILQLLCCLNKLWCPGGPWMATEGQVEKGRLLLLFNCFFKDAEPPEDDRFARSVIAMHSDQFHVTGSRCNAKCMDTVSNGFLSGKVNCSGSSFRCQENGMCIPLQWKCDGFIDCPDESDERGCHPPPLNETCKYPEMLCSDGSKCINLKKACDGTADCLDASDEGKGCDAVACLSATCLNGECHPTPRGPVCLCPDGMHLSKNGSACMSHHLCDEWGTCSQKCRTFRSKYICECFEGYKLDRDRFTCKSTSVVAPLLIISNQQQLHSINLNTLSVKTLVSNLKNSIAVDFFFSEEKSMIFWTDVGDDKIQRGILNGGTMACNAFNSFIAITKIEVVVQAGLLRAEGLAVDWIGENLYWVESDLDQIEVSKLDGSFRRTLIAGNMESPRGIAMDPRKGMRFGLWIVLSMYIYIQDGFHTLNRVMFWTDWEKGVPRIESCSMAGEPETRQIVVNVTELDLNGAWPNGLTLDYVAERIYWIDAKTDNIYTCKYDGSDHRVILKDHHAIQHPFAMALYENNIYWTDWRTNSVNKVNKWTGNNATIFHEFISQLFGLTVMHPSRQPRGGPNPCKSNATRCSHLCLLSMKSGFKCHCPHLMRLVPENMTCI
ncbi:unnamed protein product, partial [Darwinula stevensoni]